MSNRGTWDEYFMRLAREASTRATCDRLHVGCVIVRDRAIVATGYNGSARESPHCDDVGHDMVDGHCVRTNHAEMNAVALAAREGNRVGGATAYVTAPPCWPCCRLLINAGIVRIVIGDRAAYAIDPRIVAAATWAHVDIQFIDD